MITNKKIIGHTCCAGGCDGCDTETGGAVCACELGGTFGLCEPGWGCWGGCWKLKYYSLNLFECGTKSYKF